MSLGPLHSQYNVTSVYSLSLSHVNLKGVSEVKFFSFFILAFMALPLTQEKEIKKKKKMTEAKHRIYRSGLINLLIYQFIYYLIYPKERVTPKG